MIFIILFAIKFDKILIILIKIKRLSIKLFKNIKQL